MARTTPSSHRLLTLSSLWLWACTSGDTPADLAGKQDLARPRDLGKVSDLSRGDLGDMNASADMAAPDLSGPVVDLAMPDLYIGPFLVNTISPSLGPTLGGTAMTITGSGFKTGSIALQVQFGGVPATNVVLVSPFQITCKLPMSAGTRGPVQVRVINGDGMLASLGTGGSFSYYLSTWLWGAQASTAAGTGARAVAAGDFNKDGKLDLAVANPGSNNLSVLLGSGGGAFAAAVNYPVGTKPYAVTTADVNGDGSLDLLTANQGSNDVSVLLNKSDGTGAFQAATATAVGTGPQAIALSTAIFMGQPNFVTANYAAGSISVGLRSALGGFMVSPTVTTGKPAAVALADVNGDKSADVIVTYPDTNKVGILLNDGTGKFGSETTYAAGAAPTALAVADLNGDGNVDVVVTNPGGATISVLPGVAGGTLGAAKTVTVGTGPAAVSSGDLDGDGKLDLLVASGDSTLTVLQGNGDLTFKVQGPMPGSPLMVGTQPTWVGLADVTSDGLPDIVVANSGDNAVGVLVNNSK